jgi:general secretion pathway protein G
MEKAMNKKSGFTLIEILVVVAIIGLLTALLLVNLVGIRERGADTRKKSNLNQFRTALRLYYNDYQSYPAANNNNVLGCGINGISVCDQAGGDDLNNGSGTIYMKGTPEYRI